MFFEFLVIGLTALVASGLTLFSGFGLGTILMPTFAVFFPIPVAVAAAAVVHLANNLFKVGLVGRKADWGVVGRFALPAALAAILGASLLGIFDRFPPLGAYLLGGQIHEVTILKSPIVDIVRLTLYGMSFYNAQFAMLPPGIWILILASTVAAFLGAFFGERMMKKVILHTTQVLIGVMLIIVGLGMASGLI